MKRSVVDSGEIAPFWEQNPMKFFVTGTHAYGPYTDDSDLDIVVLKWDAFLIAEHIDRKGINVYRTISQDQYDNVLHSTTSDGREDVCGSFYFNLGLTIPGKSDQMKVNIISVNDENEFICWKYATEQMKKLKEPISDRQKRLNLFNYFRTKAERYLEQGKEVKV